MAALELLTLRGNFGIPVTETSRSKVRMKFASSPEPYSPAGRSATTLSIVGWRSETPIFFEADRDAFDPVAGRFRFAFLPKASSME